MKKAYTVSYEIYTNKRLHRVSFHGKLTHPLYIKAVFNRANTTFKSHYFNLLSTPRYLLFTGHEKHWPTIEEVIKIEDSLVEFVLDKTTDNFSLERFRKAYSYYGTDVCDQMESGFIDYLFTFFQDKGMPALAITVKEGCKFRILYDVVMDLKLALKPALYDELIENSLHYAPPYLPLFEFMKQFKKWPLLYLSIMELENETTRAEFKAFAQQRYARHDVPAQVDQWLIRYRKSIRGSKPRKG